MPRPAPVRQSSAGGTSQLPSSLLQMSRTPVTTPPGPSTAQNMYNDALLAPRPGQFHSAGFPPDRYQGEESVSTLSTQVVDTSTPSASNPGEIWHSAHGDRTHQTPEEQNPFIPGEDGLTPGERLRNQAEQEDYVEGEDATSTLPQHLKPPRLPRKSKKSVVRAMPPGAKREDDEGDPRAGLVRKDSIPKGGDPSPGGWLGAARKNSLPPGDGGEGPSNAGGI